jgi:ribosomal protein L9
METGTPEEKIQAKKELDAEKKRSQEGLEAWQEDFKKKVDAGKQQLYELTKKQLAKTRQETGIEISPDELDKEDKQLRKMHGLK